MSRYNKTSYHYDHNGKVPNDPHPGNRKRDEFDLEREGHSRLQGIQNAGRDHDTVVGRPPVFSKEARARWAAERENAVAVAEMIRAGEFELNRRARGRG